MRNRLFYFAGWEGVRERLGATNRFTVPTEDQRAGDFSRYNTVIYDPATGLPDGSNRTPFASNIVPLDRQSAVTRRIQQLIPLPNLPGTGANFLASGTQRLDRDNLDGKINWNPTAKHTITASIRS